MCILEIPKIIQKKKKKIKKIKTIGSPKKFMEIDIQSKDDVSRNLETLQNNS